MKLVVMPAAERKLPGCCRLPRVAIVEGQPARDRIRAIRKHFTASLPLGLKPPTLSDVIRHGLRLAAEAVEAEQRKATGGAK